MTRKTFLDGVKTSWILRQWDKVLLLLMIGLFFVLVPAQTVYTRGQKASVPSYNTIPFVTPTPAPYPVHITGYFPINDVTAEGVMVYDIDSAVTMYAKNAEESLSPASTTKIMTALVILDTFNLDDVVTIQTVANDGQVMGLVPGERITIENLLYGALVYSGNDAAWALAEHYPGGVAAFVEAMNNKARQLHLDNTHFTNPVGYDDPMHKMTAVDLTRLAAFALANKTIAKMVAIPQITVPDVTFTYFHPLTNINQLVGRIPGVGGIKTGWTEDAGENLVTLVDRDGHKIIIVVLKSFDRFADTITLINWAYANFDWRQIGPRNY